MQEYEDALVTSRFAYKLHAKVYDLDHAICMSVQIWGADDAAASAVAPDGLEESQAAGTDLESHPATLEPTPLAALHQLPSPVCKVQAPHKNTAGWAQHVLSPLLHPFCQTRSYCHS